MRQITVISGKGGTGKTTLVASLAALAKGKALIADCDVDAPDLHLLLKPDLRETREFFGLPLARLDRSLCTDCGECEDLCPSKAIRQGEIDSLLCSGCGVCRLVCPSEAIEMVERLSGHAYISDTVYGPLVDASLLPGEETSGKLVAMVREMAREEAKAHGLDLILIDGSPGIGCPVIASLTGVDLALVVTEPTISGVHDLERILSVADHFGVKSLVCINKYDLNLEMAKRIEDICGEGALAGLIPFDPAAVKSIVDGRPLVELGGAAAEAISEIWDRLKEEGFA
ncbi:MAG: ATP-binding protein [Methanotrichaceae archaeon]|nr:ATP-binding protein [Methanotrichaceae archaeon]